LVYRIMETMCGSGILKSRNYKLQKTLEIIQFFMDADADYIKELLKRTQDIGVKNVLIMIDGEGNQC
jgi:hypothetical protein